MASDDYTYGSDIGGDQAVDWSQYGQPQEEYYEYSPGMENYAPAASQEYTEEELQPLYNYLGAQEQFNPDEVLAQRGAYSAPNEPGALAALGRIFSGGGSLADIKSLIPLASSLGTMYGDYRQTQAMQDRLRGLQAQQAARAARFHAPLQHLKMNRQLAVPNVDWAHAGESPGGLQFYQGSGYSPMAEGGAVQEPWYKRVFESAKAKPAPSALGSGMASMAGQATLDRAYQNYLNLKAASEETPLPYDQWRNLRGMASGGCYMVGGQGGGQDDDVDARLSSGEYVWDADTVSALGDGNNAAGAKKLDELRQRLREHKRSAPASKIPPKAKSPEKYLKK